MAATGFTPVYIYASGTTGNIPSASNLTNTTNGSEIALNYLDGKLFYKNASNSVVTVPLLQSSGSQNGWLSSTDWTTFNNKQPAGSYALTTGTLAQFASTTSAQLAGVISDETGSGSLVFGTSPTLTTPTISGNSTISAGNEYFDYGYGIKVKLSGTDIGYVLQEYYGGSYNILSVGPAVGAGGYGYLYLNYANNGTVYNGAQLTQTGDFSVVSGNLVIGTSGKGIDFSATPGTGTSELLADYEEGTWTPTITSSGTNPTVSYTTQTGYYTKIGRMVYCQIVLNFNITGAGTGVLIASLPYVHNGDNQTTNFAHQTVGLSSGAETYNNIAPAFGAAQGWLYTSSTGTASSAAVTGSRSFVVYLMYAAT